MTTLRKICVCVGDVGGRKKLSAFLKKVEEHILKSADSRRPELKSGEEEKLFEIVSSLEEIPCALLGEPENVLSWLREREDCMEGETSIPLMLVLPNSGEWSAEMEEVVGHPQVLLEGIFRASHLLEHEDWDEQARFETAVIRILRRTLKKGTGEQSLTKPVDWKARISSQGSRDAAFLSLFTDPATQHLLGDMKFAVRDVRARLLKKAEKDSQGKQHSFFDLRNLGDKSCDWKPFRIPSVLLLGESGTGKTLVARWIAKALYGDSFGSNADLPFYRLNMGALAKELVDSELFGHVEGAYTDAKRARKGIFFSHKGWVVFLDEIGDMLPEHQVRLLAYMDSGEVRPMGSDDPPSVAPVVIVAATNRPLEQLAQRDNDGAFRHDLICRFDHTLRLPPLRERKADIRLLVSLVLQDEDVNPRTASGEPWVGRISLKAVVYLEGLPYPGNFRELRTLLARGVRCARQEGERVLCLHHLI